MIVQPEAQNILIFETFRQVFKTKLCVLNDFIKYFSGYTKSRNIKELNTFKSN